MTFWAVGAAIGGAIIGGVASNKAAGKGAKALKDGQEILAKSASDARREILTLFPEAQRAGAEGLQTSRQFLTNQVLPQQASLFQQGNVAAQNQLIGALPQSINAITGQPINLSSFQPQQFDLPSFDLTGTPGNPEPIPDLTPDQLASVASFIEGGGLEPFLNPANNNLVPGVTG